MGVLFNKRTSIKHSITYLQIKGKADVFVRPKISRGYSAKTDVIGIIYKLSDLMNT